MTDFDLIVIGAGPVGENVADRAVRGGLTAVVVESELVGGECSYWACMPSKALIRSNAALQGSRSVDGAKQAVTGGLDVAAVLRRRDRFVHDWHDDSQVEWLQQAGIALVRGHGRLSGPREVTVTAEDGGMKTLTAAHAVAICTGSAARLPDVEGLLQSTPWTSRDATSAWAVPGSLAIVGGGAVAVEMATAYAGLGCAVTVVSRSPLLSRSEPFAGEAVAAGLRALGATVITDALPRRVHRDEEGNAVIALDTGGTVVAEQVLVAAGRVPRTGDLGLESIGLAAGEWLRVDDTLRVVGTDWLYAAGDVNHRALLTHQGKYQARAAGDAIVARAQGEPVHERPWGSHVATADHSAVPQVVFSDPEVASVGMTAEQAEKAGYDIRVVDYDLGSVAGAALHADGYAGQARMVVDTGRSLVLGMTFVGREVAELLHAATVAVVGQVPIERLWHAVPAYPTMSEVWLRLLEAYGRPR